ncbi:activator of Hsp90 ATPase protein 1 [Marchantia polymorpha subsp. ruderalis]|uniref:Activator of Hsp90 ATPase AHSA1-like N-terminal domain-containing protein n=2 Tax=Marchantia polymorpha TaxID=3197 RepID=A0A176VZB0_MARPO|nr:hypothetical protein AXG93_4022s1090 [Marchantia polymorpha subsp. ruderalis]PTQ31591.1 hypothetical protein MARPO_0109s0023 [Marchantia polymorpha]BBN02633.1 hypothetical protein Mp_2g16820 [Marchantia polymorpha subsp. ruderalis]|eukprot:PTQ31591.1 hypothetical protein MARPO_0109s0023 [Marchantia polymorpha]
MAKFGEGDKRWIVEDRKDGANVHNWHWSEKDCMEWSKKRLEELLNNVPILSGEGGLWISTTTVESVAGEAYVNIRKGKIIPGYELKVRVSWVGEAKDGSGTVLSKVEGKVEFPYIADENADEEPEVKILVLDETPIGQRMKDAFHAKGKSIVLARVLTYVKEIAAGGPAKDELEGKGTPLKGAVGKGKSVLSGKDVVVEKAVVPPKNKLKEGFKTISIVEKFHCRPRDLYTTLLDENRWKGFTQSKATISKEVGGSFTLFDGAIAGVNEELQEDKLIRQKWRFNNWADGHFSHVSLTFEEPEIGLTVVKLTHTDVPEEDRYGNATVVENTEKGWRDLIFHKIRAVFGYGI